MNLVYLGLGVILLVGTVVDLLWTTLWDEGGAGPLTTLLMKGTWGGLVRATHGRSRPLSVSGPVILTLGLLVWLALIWAGWTLIFASAEGAVFDVIDDDPVSWFDLAYYAGYTVFTLGNGGFAPEDGAWQIVTVLTTASGMLLVTLSVTYVLSVLDAVTQKHAFADGVTGVGTSVEEMARAYWNGEKFDGLDLHLDTFSSEINTLTANHKAYPVLHYFHSPQAEKDPLVAVAVLDETLTLFRFGIAERHQPSQALLKDTRSSVGSLLDAIETLHSPADADRSPPAPDLDPVREADLPTVSDEEYAEILGDEALDERRRQLLGVVEGVAREWPPIDDE